MAQHDYLGNMSGLWAGPEWLQNTNLAQRALATLCAGPQPPLNPLPGQQWWDTSASPAVLRVRNWSGSGWTAVGDYDGSTMRWYAGGAPMGTAAQRNAGTNANDVVALDSQGRLPAVDGSQLTNMASTYPVGWVSLAIGATPPSGWLWLNGATMGTVASGATHAGTTYEALYAWIWGQISATWAPMYTSGGSPTSRGASAAADWAANRRLALPDYRGSTLLVLDALGGSAAGRVTAASTGGANASTMAARGGAETHTLTEPQLPQVVISTTGRTPSNHDGGTQVEATSSGSTVSVQIATFGGGQAHNNMPPWGGIGLIIKY